MPRQRALSEKDERRLLADADLRDKLTDKALAARWNIPLRTLQSILLRCRQARQQAQ